LAPRIKLKKGLHHRGTEITEKRRNRELRVDNLGKAEPSPHLKGVHFSVNFVPLW